MFIITYLKPYHCLKKEKKDNSLWHKTAQQRLRCYETN